MRSANLALVVLLSMQRPLTECISRWQEVARGGKRGQEGARGGRGAQSRKSAPHAKSSSRGARRRQNHLVNCFSGVVVDVAHIDPGNERRTY